MTLLGKIFTMLVLLLSLAFFIVSLLANSTHIEHKKKVTAYQTQVKQLETTVDELKKFTEQLQTSRAQEQVARKAALAGLQTQLDSAKEQLAQATTELNTKGATLTEQTQKMGETIDRVKLLTSQNDAMKVELDKIVTDRDGQRRRVIGLTDKLNGLQSVETDLRSQVNQLQNDTTYFQAKAETASAALKFAGIKDPEDVPPSDLKGEVLSVNSKQAVVVSVGKDDGLREGHNLEVYRSGQYLGQIQIRKVYDDQAIGQIVQSMHKGFVQAGDKVAAKVH